MAHPVYVHLIKNEWKKLKEFIEANNSSGQIIQPSDVGIMLRGYMPDNREDVNQKASNYLISNNWEHANTEHIDKIVSAISQKGFSMDVIAQFELQDHLWQLYTSLEESNTYIEHWKQHISENLSVLGQLSTISNEIKSGTYDKTAESIELQFAGFMAVHSQILKTGQGSPTKNTVNSLSNVASADTQSSAIQESINKLTISVSRLSTQVSSELGKFISSLDAAINKRDIRDSLARNLVTNSDDFINHCYNKGPDKLGAAKGLERKNRPKRIIEHLLLLNQVKERSLSTTHRFRANIFILFTLTIMASLFACLTYYYFSVHLPVVHFILGVSLVVTLFISALGYHFYQQRKISALSKYVHDDRAHKSAPQHDNFVAMPLGNLAGEDDEYEGRPNQFAQGTSL